MLANARFASWNLMDFFFKYLDLWLVESLDVEPTNIEVDCIYNRILFSHKQEENLAICNNMDESWRHYAKWNKPERERQILYDLTYMWNLQSVEFIETDKWVISRSSRAEKNGEKLVTRYKLSLVRWISSENIQ